MEKKFTTLKPVPFESLDNTTTNSDQIQELIHYFLGTPDTYSTPPIMSLVQMPFRPFCVI
jgi:hypothetical protein